MQRCGLECIFLRWSSIKSRVGRLVFGNYQIPIIVS